MEHATSLVIASGNIKKRKEIEELLEGVPCRVLTLADFPDCPEIEETGATFEDNAILKAVAVAVFTGHLTLADDSGLEVDALGGAPGVHSARFASAPDEGNASDEANLELLLEKLEGTADAERTARFVCAMALARPSGPDQAQILATSRGTVEGLITREARGTYGFGYDPVFLIEQHGKTFAELGGEIKQSMSHRANALRRIKGDIVAQLEAGTVE